MIAKNNLIWQDPARLWRETIRVSPASVAGHNNLGWIYYKNKDWDRAEDEFIKASRLSASPRRQAGVQVNLAEVLWRKGRKEAAYESLERAVSLNPEAARAYDVRGHFYFQEGKIEPATIELEKARRIAPYGYLIHDHLAQAYAARERLRRAESSLRRALELRPDFPLGWDHLGIILARRGKKAEAAECWHRALRLDPGLASARKNLAASGFQ